MRDKFCNMTDKHHNIMDEDYKDDREEKSGDRSNVLALSVHQC